VIVPPFCRNTQSEKLPAVTEVPHWFHGNVDVGVESGVADAVAETATLSEAAGLDDSDGLGNGLDDSDGDGENEIDNVCDSDGESVGDMDGVGVSRGVPDANGVDVAS
jgi:hypothetical protein